MKKARFYLNNPKNEKNDTLIFLMHKCFDKRLKYSTFQRIFPKQWDSKSMRVKGRKAEAKYINGQLDIMESTFISH